MQQILYRDSPYLVTAYPTTGEAVRSDRFACFQPQPDPGGVWLIQYGVHNYIHMRPADRGGQLRRRRPALTGAVTATASGNDVLDHRTVPGSAPASWSLVVLVGGGVRDDAAPGHRGRPRVSPI